MHISIYQKETSETGLSFAQVYALIDALPCEEITYDNIIDAIIHFKDWVLVLIHLLN